MNKCLIVHLFTEDRLFMVRNKGMSIEEMVLALQDILTVEKKTNMLKTNTMIIKGIKKWINPTIMMDLKLSKLLKKFKRKWGILEILSNRKTFLLLIEN